MAEVSKSTVQLEGETKLIVERTFNAPRELLFRAYSHAEHLSKWWAPEGFTVSHCTVDFRPGGVWHYAMRSPEGQDHWGKGVYREIVDNEQIVYVDTFSDAEGTSVPPETLITVKFIDAAGKTVLRMESEFGSAEARQATVDMGAVQGMDQVLDKLADLLPTLA